MFAVNKKQLPSRERSPFARRILSYLRSNDPPLTEAELARRVNVSRQSMHAWMWNDSVPDERNVIALATVMGCKPEDIKEDLQASVGWEPPIPFVAFLAQVEATANREHWADKENILPWIRIAVSWQDVDGPWVDMARDLLRDKRIPLRQKAVRLARIVAAQRQLGDDLTRP